MKKLYIISFDFSNRRGKKAGAGLNKKHRVNNSTSSHNAKGTDNTNSNNTSRKSSTSSNTVNASFISSQRRDSKPKVFKPCLPPSLLASSNVADLSDTEGQFLIIVILRTFECIKKTHIMRR